MIKKIQFPKDELKHNNIIEWWYFNGNLKDKKGNQYSYMHCFFKANTKKAKIPLYRLPSKYSFFSHSIISDIKHKKAYSKIRPLIFVSDDSFSQDFLKIKYTFPSLEGLQKCLIKKINNNTYKIKTEDLNLTLISKKEPFMVNKTGFLSMKSRSTYYYSLTNIATKGKIKIGNKWVSVEGKSWMDHQWANAKYVKDKWTWFSIQLGNKAELICFEYKYKNILKQVLGICYPAGKRKHLSKFKLIPTKKQWESKKTDAKYPLNWEIKVPGKLNLKISPLLKNQEMLFGEINYWEGPIKISGTLDKNKVKGNGFMELKHPSKINPIEILARNLVKEIEKDLKSLKNLGNNIFKS